MCLFSEDPLITGVMRLFLNDKKIFSYYFSSFHIAGLLLLLLFIYLFIYSILNATSTCSRALMHKFENSIIYRYVLRKREITKKCWMIHNDDVVSSVCLSVRLAANQSSSVVHTLHGDIGNQEVIKLNSFPLFRVEGGGGAIVSIENWQALLRSNWNRYCGCVWTNGNNRE